MAYTGGGRGSGMGNGSYGGGRSPSDTGAGQKGGMGGWDGGGRGSGNGGLTLNHGYDPVKAMRDIIGSSWTTGPNSLHAFDPYTGLVTQVGRPSLTGRGMMTTSRGGMLGFMDGMRSGNMNQAWQGMSLSNPASPYHGGYYNNLQNNIRSRFTNKVAAQGVDRVGLANRVAKGEIDPLGRIMGTKAANKGMLSELEGYLGQPSAMRATHNTGGIFGNMFDMKGDDVQTTHEDFADLRSSGHLDENGNTPAWGGPVNPVGMLTSITAPGVAQKTAEAVYGATKSVPGAIGTGQAVQTGMKAAGYAAQPDAFAGFTRGYVDAAMPGYGKARDMAVKGMSSIPTAVASMITGVPVGMIGQMGSALKTAATLNSYGITAPGSAPSYQTRNDSTAWWPHYGGGLLT